MQVLDGNPQGIARALFEAAKLGHGRFDRFDTGDEPNAAMAYLQNTMLLDSTLLQWLYFAAIILASLIASRITIAVLQIRQKNHAAASDNRLTLVSVALETMRKYIYTLAFLLAVKKGLAVLTLSPAALRTVNTGLVVAVIWLATFFAARLFARFMLRWRWRGAKPWGIFSPESRCTSTHWPGSHSPPKSVLPLSPARRKRDSPLFIGSPRTTRAFFSLAGPGLPAFAP